MPGAKRTKSIKILLGTLSSVTSTATACKTRRDFVLQAEWVENPHTATSAGKVGRQRLPARGERQFGYILGATSTEFVNIKNERHRNRGLTGTPNALPLKTKTGLDAIQEKGTSAKRPPMEH